MLSGPLSFPTENLSLLARRQATSSTRYFVKAKNLNFTAWADFVRPQSSHWDKLKMDSVMMHYVKEYARVRREGG